jgi:hypothetical protein
MALHQPVPSGGRAGNLVLLESDGCSLCDGPLTLIGTGSGGALTLPQKGSSGPANATPYWIKIGVDSSSGADVFMPVWM